MTIDDPYGERLGGDIPCAHCEGDGYVTLGVDCVVCGGSGGSECHTHHCEEDAVHHGLCSGCMERLEEEKQLQD